MNTRYLAGLALLASVAHATPPAKSDFAYAAEIETSQPAAVYRLSVPESVYRGTYRSDLGDLRVFDSRGHAVPHQMSNAPAAETISTLSDALPLFPVPANNENRPGATDGSVSVQIRGSAEETLLELRRSAGIDSADTPVGTYIVDASGLGRRFDLLELAWTPTDQSFLAELALEVSQDLRQWRTLPGTHLIGVLQHDGRQVERNRVEFQPVEAQYLRVRWAKPQPPAVLTEARLRTLGTAEQEPVNWLPLEGAAPDAAGGLVFDSGGHFPTERLEIALPQENMLLTVRISSRSDPDRPWQTRFDGPVYRLGAQRSDDIAIPRTTDRYWRMAFADNATPQGADAVPTLSLGWRQHALDFVAQGEPPYTLAYGAYGVTPSVTAAGELQRLIASGRVKDMVATAQVRSAYELGGPARLTPPPPPRPWQQWILWGALVLGVGLLALMASGLVRQMNAKPD